MLYNALLHLSGLDMPCVAEHGLFILGKNKVFMFELKEEYNLGEVYIREWSQFETSLVIISLGLDIPTVLIYLHLVELKLIFEQQNVRLCKIQHMGDSTGDFNGFSLLQIP